MKQKLFLCLLVALLLSLCCACAFAETEPIVHLSFDGGEEEYTLVGGAVLEDGAVKLPGGELRTGGYIELPYAALLDTSDQVTISMWMYIPADTTVNSYMISFANGNDWPAFYGCVLPSGQVAINFDNRGDMVTEPCFPMDSWTYLTVTISKTQMKVFLNGQRVSMYDGEASVFENCFWNRINGADTGTTHYHELDKINLPSGMLGTPPYPAYFDLRGDMKGMFGDYRIYDVALSEEEVAALYAAQTVPFATYPIGSAPDPDQTVAKIEVAPPPEDGLRVSYTFDGTDEGYTLFNGAKVEDGVLTLPGGAFREAGHLELPENSIVNCGKAMTISTWINLADGAGVGDQFIFAISAGEGWPALYLYVQQDGTIHYNVDYRSVLNLDATMIFGRWAYLTAVLSETEVTVYLDGELAGGYDKTTLKTTNGNWEMLNVQNDSTHFCDIDRTANYTMRLGSAFMDIGYDRVDADAQYDNFRIYSRALSAEEAAQLYAEQCAETNYDK